MSKHRVTCTYHCRECGSHFSSLSAFDKHREGDHAVERFCAEPEDVRTKSGEPALVAKATDGLCRLHRRGPMENVTVWTVPFDTAFTWRSVEKGS